MRNLRENMRFDGPLMKSKALMLWAGPKVFFPGSNLKVTVILLERECLLTVYSFYQLFAASQAL